MSVRQSASLAALVAVLMLVSSHTFAQQKDGLGPEHKRLEMLVGTWNAKVRDYEPGKPPVESSGTMVRTMIFGGRYLKEDFKASIAGSPFQGMGLIGYDSMSRRYVSVWLDSSSTDMLISFGGAYNDATKTFTYESEQVDPDGRRVKARDVLRILSNDEHIFEMHRGGTQAGAKEFKILDIRFTRKR